MKPPRRLNYKTYSNFIRINSSCTWGSSVVRGGQVLYVGVKGGRVHPLTAKNLPKIGKKREKIRKNREKKEKIGKKRKNREGSFTLPLLTDRAGYATVPNTEKRQRYTRPACLTRLIVPLVPTLIAPAANPR